MKLTFFNLRMRDNKRFELTAEIKNNCVKGEHLKTTLSCFINIKHSFFLKKINIWINIWMLTMPKCAINQSSKDQFQQTVTLPLSVIKLHTCAKSC